MSSTSSSSARQPQARETTEGKVYTVTGGDWDEVVSRGPRTDRRRLVINMGPAAPLHPRRAPAILDLDGETVTEARSASATCTPASRRTWSSGRGPRAPRS